MPAVNPAANNGTVAPGIVTDPNKFPQWGVGNVGGTWQVIEAKNATDKQNDLNKGYAAWFSDQQDAQNFAKDQTGFLSGNYNPLSGIAGVLTAFYHAVTDGKMWRSVGWIVLGVLLMLAGVALWIGPSASRSSPIGLLARNLG